MFEKVSIIIPFQTDNGPREEAFHWIKRFYEQVMPEAEICIGIIDNVEVNKSKAVNLAAKEATRDIFVIADADVIFDPKLIIESIKLLQEAAMVVPFKRTFNMKQSGTQRLLKTKPSWPVNIKPDEYIKRHPYYEGFAGKLVVISRKNFETVGGFDERFIGWGGEDDAFSLSVQTLCGKLVNLSGIIYHLWHPKSTYITNPYGKENGKLLKRYKLASENKHEMTKLISERKIDIGHLEHTNLEIINNIENAYMRSPKSKICFAVLVHEKRELVKQLINNIRFFCPNSAIFLYNGGYDWNLCEGLGVPVCPSSQKLRYGYTTNYFLEMMEWIEGLGIKYDYFINIDSDALFFRKGYEEFIQSEMKDTDYMAVRLRIPEKNWFIARQLRKDINRWKQVFNVKLLYGVFNVGQVISRSVVKALLEPERIKKLKKALFETISWGTDEVLFVNMAKELGFRIKPYPSLINTKLIRFRPYFTINEMINYVNNDGGFLCHPVHRDEEDPVRKFIQHIEKGHDVELYTNKEYPWHENNPTNFSISFPIKGKDSHFELIVRSESSLTHFRQQQSDGKWYKVQTFAEDVTGSPIFFETALGEFMVACKLITNGIGLWRREDNTDSWIGPTVYQHEDIDSIIGSSFY